MEMQCVRSLSVAIGCSVLLTVNVHSSLIYGTLGPDPYTPSIFNDSIFWAYGPFSGGSGVSFAAPFSFTGLAYQLDSITVDIGIVPPQNTANLQIGIFADDGGHPSLMPITLVEPDPTGISTLQTHLFTYSFPGQSVLAPNTPYWLAFQPRFVGSDTEAFNAEYIISQSRVPSTTPIARRTFSGTWSEWINYQNAAQPAFRLDGTAVPEPGTWALLWLGSALLWCATRRRRK